MTHKQEQQQKRQSFAMDMHMEMNRISADIDGICSGDHNEDNDKKKNISMIHLDS